MNKEQIITTVNGLIHRAYQTSKDHGFWEAASKDETLYKLSQIALMHSELSECVEGVRKDSPDDHLPNRSMEVAELADTIIRVFNYAGGYNLPLAEVLLEKMDYNDARPFKHGGKKA